MLWLAMLAGAAALVVALPHAVPAAGTRAPLSAAIWMLALTVRALVSVSVALLALAYAPHTEAFEYIAAQCWHAVVPVLTLRFELDGHGVADTAAILPSVALLGSIVAACASLARACWRLRRRLAARTLGRGPLGARVVADNEVLVAVTAFGRAEIVLSSAALEQLDPDELEASLFHERAHIERRHRPLLVAGRVLCAIARPLPGTRAAERRLALSLERDADEHAVRSTGDRLALASAICKAAGVRTSGAAIPLSGNGAALARLDALLEQRPRGDDRVVAALATAQGAVAALIVLLLLGWLLGAAGQQAAAHLAALCAY